MLEQEFEYKVTVIIPVYNVENYLAEALESLLAQTIPQEEMEVLMINDGSTDGSPAICEEYANKYPNFKVISQENQGVSAARNAGIRRAKGKYLLYLDGDDTLSPETVWNVTEFFDQHYDEVDVVGYPIRFHYENGMVIPHQRDKILTSTGVYDIHRTLHVNLTTINAAVKNMGKNNFLFSIELFYHEDEAYLADAVLRKEKYGYVVKACYNYMKRSDGVSEKFSNPQYIFNQSIKMYMYLIRRYTKGGEVSPYVQSLILNDFSWKIKANKLLPPKKDEQVYKHQLSALSNIVNRIASQKILTYPQLNDAYKYYLLSLKTKDSPFLFVSNHELSIVNQSGTLYAQRSILIVWNTLQVERGDMLYGLGYIKCYAFAFCRDEPKLFVLEGHCRREIPIFLSQLSCFWTDMETNRFWGFHFSCSLATCQEIRFEVQFRGAVFPTNFWYSSKLQVQPDIGRVFLRGGANSVLLKKNVFKILPTECTELKMLRRSYEKGLFKQHRKQWVVRRLMECVQKKRVWLYSDSHDSLDNGYYQFQHDFSKRDGIKRYYVYHADNPKLIEGKFSAKQRRYLVPFQSKRHKTLMAAAEKVLVAFSGRSSFLPFDPETYRLYADMFHYEVVYLQHGVMHAKLPNMYSKEKVWQVDKVVVSTHFEWENLQKLGYRKEDILTCGMPRLDRLENRETEKRKILFAPSWRANLVHTVDGVQTATPQFFESVYYKTFSAFLSSGELRELLEQYDLYLDIQIHPMFCCYGDAFLSECGGRIAMTSFANAGDYLLCITDFSSFMFDFCYLEKPVINLFPDREQFKAGLHSYSDFYYPLEDGFGLYCEDVPSAIEALKRLLQSNFSMPDQVKKRVETLFFSKEASHAQSLYQVLTEEDKPNGV